MYYKRSYSGNFRETGVLTLPVPIPDEEKKKINFYFNTTFKNVLDGKG